MLLNFIKNYGFICNLTRLAGLTGLTFLFLFFNIGLIDN